MEACISSMTIRNAGEFNGFLKPKNRIFGDPLQFIAGELVLPAGFTPTVDANELAAHETAVALCAYKGPTGPHG
jgi:L-Ala-D/L-Glu epimerase